MLTSKLLIDWFDKHDIPVDKHGMTLGPLVSWDISSRETKEIPKGQSIFTIESLDLSYKQIKDIPKELGLLNKLEYLCLIGNPIQELPDEFENLESLGIIDIRNTPLAKEFILPIPDTVYGLIRDDETANLIYGNKPKEYFLPYYSAGVVDGKLIILLYRDLYDLKTGTISPEKTLYQIMKDKLPQKLVEKFGHYINEKDKSQGIYFDIKDKDKIQDFMYSTSEDPLLKVGSYQELVSEVIQKLSK